MRINYCIIVHAHEDIVRRFILNTSGPNVKYFIHVDLKADLEKFTLKLSDLDNIFFVKERVNVIHGGFSQNEALLQTLLTASSQSDGYFLMVSGQCYPIKDQFFIQQFFDNSRDLNYIGFYPLVPGSNNYSHISRYYFRDLAGKHYYLKYIFRALEKLRIARRFRGTFRPFRGSCWSALTLEATRYVIEYMNTSDGADLRRNLLYAFGSDEILMQTILLNSDLRHKCAGYSEFERTGISPMADEAFLHYIDWSSSRENPAVLDDSDFDKIIVSKKLFARKFNNKKSLLLMNKIDEHIESSRPTPEV